MHGAVRARVEVEITPLVLIGLLQRQAAWLRRISLLSLSGSRSLECDMRHLVASLVVPVIVLFLTFPSSSAMGQENQPPLASFTCLPEQPHVGEKVTCDASSSYDPDGAISEYAWDFDNDGVLDADGIRAEYRYDKAEQYEIRLLVLDNKGLASSAARAIVVLGGGGERNRQWSLGVVWFIPAVSHMPNSRIDFQGGMLLLGKPAPDLFFTLGIDIKRAATDSLKLSAGMKYIYYSSSYGYSGERSIQHWFIPVMGLEIYLSRRLAISGGIGFAIEFGEWCVQGGCTRYTGSVLVPFWEMRYLL